MARVSVALPAYNESRIIANSIRKMVGSLTSWYGDNEWELIVVDNGSTDDTFEIASSLSRTLPNVVPIRIEQRGLGAALRAGWGAANGDVLAYVDSDLPFRMENVADIINKTINDSDVTIGSRHMQGGLYQTTTLRSFLSNVFIRWVNLLYGCNISDSSGIKGLKKEAFLRLLPMLKDNEWFFGIELIVGARKLGLKVKEVPVQVCNNNSRPSSVRIFNTAVMSLERSLLLKLRMSIDSS